MMLAIAIGILKVGFMCVAGVVLATIVNFVVSDIAQDHPSLDPYSFAFAWWTFIVTAVLNDKGCILLLIGFVPAILSHCRVSKHPRRRRQILRIPVESIRIVRLVLAEMTPSFIRGQRGLVDKATENAGQT